jgi:hypothetical protein
MKNLNGPNARHPKGQHQGKASAPHTGHGNEDPPRIAPVYLKDDDPILEDPRYLLRIASRDPITHSVHGFRIRCLDVPELYSRRLLSSGLLSPLRGKFLLVAMALCDCVLAERFIQSHIQFPASDLRRLKKARANLKSILQRMENLMKEFLEFERNTPSRRRRLSLRCERSEGMLRKLYIETSKPKSIRARREDFRARRRAGWMFDRPALAYALRLLFEESGQTEVPPKQILDRIGTFQIKFMGHSIASGLTVAQQIRRFSKLRHRVRKIRNIVHELLKRDWYPMNLSPGMDDGSIAHLYVQKSFP